MKIEDKALAVIDRLVSDDLSENLEWQLYDKRLENLTLSQEDMKILFQKIGVIYRIAHSAIKTHCCYDVHTDWRKEIERLYKKLS